MSSLGLAEGKTVRDWAANCDQSQSCIAETTAGGYRLQVGRYAGDPKTLEIIEQKLRAAGVEFIDQNGGGPGVRLRKPAKQKR